MNGMRFDFSEEVFYRHSEWYGSVIKDWIEWIAYQNVIFPQCK